MVVLKFGGTSVGKPERMKKIAELVLGTPGKKLLCFLPCRALPIHWLPLAIILLAGQKAKAEEETTRT